MGYKQVVRRLFESATGTRVYRTVPRGTDLFEDIRNFLPKVEVSIVFDVGANIGQSAKEFARHFPASQIRCFEPVDITYRRLQHELRDHANVRTYKLALGAEAGPRQMVLLGGSEMFRLRTESEIATLADEALIERVALQTVDEFCESHGIAQINFLKIDTEGHDLDVLRGAEGLLQTQKIDLIQVEAGMNRLNRRHVPFEDFTSFLDPRGYFLFAIYEQMNEWITGAPNLRRTNPVFVSERIIKLHTLNHPGFVGGSNL